LEEALLKAIKFAGSQKKLSVSLGVGRAVINNWLNTGIKVPLKYAMRIEVFTNGLIQTENLVPDAKHEVYEYRKYLLKKFFDKNNVETNIQQF
jgi:DNA-binding transcriptional regulator YdaS (Cro superfamily)